MRFARDQRHAADTLTVSQRRWFCSAVALPCRWRPVRPATLARDDVDEHDVQRPTFQRSEIGEVVSSIGEKTNFGDTDAPKTIYSNFNFTLDIARPLNYFWFKLLLPLLIVLIASLGGMFIFPSYVEARLSLPIGGLLTAVFLQHAYTDALPDVAYMVLMDKIYVLSYCFITLVLLQLIRDGNWYKTHKDAANITSLSRRLRATRGR